MRAVMCVGIMLYHFVPYFFGKGDWQYESSRFFAYFTDMFFVFAGLFLARSSADQVWTLGTVADFLVKRMARLYPLHLVTLTFYVVLGTLSLAHIASTSNAARYDMAGLLPQLSLTHAWGWGNPMSFDYPSWALSAIFLCYLLFPLVSLASARSELLLASLIIGFIGLGTAVAWWLSSDLTSLQGRGLGAFRALPSFLFGVFVARRPPEGWSKPAAALLLGVAIGFAFARATPLEGPARLCAVYLLIAAVMAADRAELWTPLSMRWLQALGRYSFGVYLLHLVIASVLFRLVMEKLGGWSLRSLGDHSIWTAYGALLIGVVASFQAAWISLRTIERHGARLFIAAMTGARRPLPSARPKRA